ncbi:MAG: SemiSWEET transporter [Devosiaceae bacterium]|nr:SemiSWEET transporter [Devosiaceae bacterium]
MPTWTVEAIGMFAALLGTICWAPQTIKTIRTRDTKSLSLGTNLLLLSTVILWLIYGIALNSFPLIIANLVSMILVGIIVVLKLKHG